MSHHGGIMIQKQELQNGSITCGGNAMLRSLLLSKGQYDI
jgi:hypothetical protein